MHAQLPRLLRAKEPAGTHCGSCPPPLPMAGVSVLVLQPDPQLRPRLLLQPACSGSTFVMDEATRLLRHLGVPAYNANEGLKPTRLKQPYFRGAAVGVGRAFEEQCAAHAADGALVVVKAQGWWDLRQDNVSATLRSLGVRSANVIRANELDRTVCLVRDCLDVAVGRKVLADGRPAGAGACSERFGARETAGGSARLAWMQTQVEHSAAPPAPASAPMSVLLNTSRLVEHLRASAAGAREHALRKYLGEQRPGPTLTYERLVGFQYADGAARAASVGEWVRLLGAWGFERAEKPSTRDAVAAYFAPRAGSRAPPRPHRDLIYNHDEVRAALIAAGGRFRELYRDETAGH
jgi:hypothetical protein